MVHIQLESLEKYAKENHVPIMLKDGINYLTDYIKKNNIQKVLEIGSAIGYSAIKMALVNENIKVTTIEKNKTMYEIALKNVNNFNLSSQICILNEDALDVDIVDKYDLIFIDAAKSQYIKFFNKFKDNLTANGVIITDNLNFHGLVKDDSNCSRNTRQLVRKIRNYITFLKENTEFKTEFIELGDGISVSKKSEL